MESLAFSVRNNTCSAISSVRYEAEILSCKDYCRSQRSTGTRLQRTQFELGITGLRTFLVLPLSSGSLLGSSPSVCYNAIDRHDIEGLGRKQLLSGDQGHSYLQADAGQCLLSGRIVVKMRVV